MMPMPGHHGSDAVAVILTGLLGVFVLGYLAVVWACSRRGRPWPWSRTACAIAGSGIAGIGGAALHQRAMDSFTLHMCSHLMVGMLAPLLLAWAQPITLSLRTLPTREARILVKLLHSRLPRLLSRPTVAAVINITALWLLYTTRIFPAMHHHTWLDMLIHLHLLMAGWLFSTVILATEPDPHPASHRHRAAVLICFMALHTILTQYLYRHPPMGVPPDEAHTAAQLMYYGGDWIDLALIIGLCRHWYRHTRPTQPPHTETTPLPSH